MNLLKKYKEFKTFSSYFEYRRKKLKKRLMYALLSGFGFIFYSQSYKNEILYHFDNTQENVEIIKNCKHLRLGTFKPTSYLFTPFLQTIYGAKFDSVPYLKYDREEIQTPDGGQLALDWSPIHQKFDDTENLRILLLVHGLTGGSDTNYMKYAALNGYRYGFRVVTLNERGINQEYKNHVWRDLSKTDDLKLTVEHIKKKYPNAKLYGLGISIGANSLIKYVGQEGENSGLSGIVSISNPWNLFIQNKFIEQWSKKIYYKQLTSKIINNFKQNIEILSKNAQIYDVDIEKAKNCKTLRDFDEIFTRRVNGYKSVDDFYRNVGCQDYVLDIKIPTLCIQSLDDPVCDNEVIPKNEIKKNSNIILVMTQRGGHIDYFTGYKAWVYWPAMEYLNYIDKINNVEEIEV